MRAIALAVAVLAGVLTQALTLPARARPDQGSTVCPSGCDFSAIGAALAAAGAGDRISVLPGVYTETLTLKAGVEVAGTPGRSVIRGAGRGPVISVAGASVGADTVLSGFVVEDGAAPDGAGIHITGGAAPTLIGLIIRNNQAVGAGSRGGGLFSASSSPVVRASSFISNAAGTGGGVYIEGGSAALDGIGFARNRAAVAGGGAALIATTSRLQDSLFVANAAAGSGGGAFAKGGSPTLTNVEAIGFNSAIAGGGLAIEGGRAAIRHSRIISNTAGALGGGVAIYAGALPELFDSVVAWNRSVGGGAGVSFDGSDGSIAYSTIEGNYGIQGGNGDGVYVFGAGTSPLLRANIIADNDYGVRGPEVGRPDRLPSPVLDHNDVWNNRRGDLVGVGIAGQAGQSGNLSQNPLFAGPTELSFFLSQRAAGQAVDSPALDAGPEDASAAGLADRTTRTDRVADSGPADLGYHHPAVPPTATPTAALATDTPTLQPTESPTPPAPPRAHVEPPLALAGAGRFVTLTIEVAGLDASVEQPAGRPLDPAARRRAGAGNGPLAGYRLIVTYAPGVIEFAGFRSGSLAGSGGGSAHDLPASVTPGRAVVGSDIDPGPGPWPQSGTLVEIGFRALSPGRSPVRIERLELIDARLGSREPGLEHGVVVVTSGGVYLPISFARW